MKRRLTLAFWKLVNPLAVRLAGFAPFWVVLETTGRRTGRIRRVPLARGPVEGDTTWVIAAQGRHSAFVRNIEADPRVRIRLRGRWRDATAAVEPMDPAIVRRFNLYARSGPATVGIDPMLVRVTWRPDSETKEP